MCCNDPIIQRNKATKRVEGGKILQKQEVRDPLPTMLLYNNYYTLINIITIIIIIIIIIIHMPQCD